jgi:4-hydroxybenzoate polyprenyltransferase
MPNKFLQITAVMRLDIPSGYLLVFFPATYGLLLSLTNLQNLYLIPILFFGSVFARSAGCVINDIFDRNLDSKVARTRDRPIASGSMKITEALTLICFLLSLCLIILLSMTFTSILVGMIAFLMIVAYPLTKRLTYFPQIFLGGTFNLGVLIAYAAIDDHISFDAMMLYIGCCFWTVGYDTIYAFMDIKDDKKIGVKSTAIFFEKGLYKTFIAICYLSFIALFIKAVWAVGDCQFAIIAAILSLAIFLWQVYTLNINDVKNCLQRFNSNQLVGLILFVGMLTDRLL